MPCEKLTIVYPNDPHIKPVYIDDIPRYKLINNWIYKDEEIEFEIPAGFIFESSVPRLTWTISGLHSGSILTGSLPHDWLYAHNGLIQLTNGEWITIPKKKADKIFYKIILEKTGKRWRDKVRAWFAYRSVKNFGNYPEKRKIMFDNDRYNQ